MSNKTNLASCFFLAALLFTTGCATKPPVASGPPAQVPSIKVTLDCGACQVRPTVPALIMQGYSEAAKNAGAVILPAREATVSIQDYSARSDAGRFLVGAFAGKDEIKVLVSNEGKQFSVEDYYRNAWQGIESLALKIGEDVFTKLKP
ncbi:MAG: hypothetical protein V4646_20375 [Pseudomonadota bacterium]